MRGKRKIDLISEIGRDLQSRYTFSEIDAYLKDFDIDPPAEPSYNSKWVYVREALAGKPDEIIVEIARDLDIEGFQFSDATPPEIWPDDRTFRLFISHISLDKDKANRLKTCLEPYNISGFVAHEDILPTKAWQEEIERALFSMDALLAIHTKGFKDSFWTQQEIGFALGRGIRVISLKMPEDPVGFISKHQALARKGRNAEAIAEHVNRLLCDDPSTAARMKAITPSSSIFDLEDEIPF